MYQTSGTDPGEEQRNIAIPISSFQSATNVQHRFVPQETSGQQIPATKSGSQKRKQRGTPTLLNNVTDQPGSSNAGTDSSFV